MNISYIIIIRVLYNCIWCKIACVHINVDILLSIHAGIKDEELCINGTEGGTGLWLDLIAFACITIQIVVMDSLYIELIRGMEIRSIRNAQRSVSIHVCVWVSLRDCDGKVFYTCTQMFQYCISLFEFFHEDSLYTYFQLQYALIMDWFYYFF